MISNKSKIYAQEIVLTSNVIISKAVKAIGGEDNLRNLDNKNNCCVESYVFNSEMDLVSNNKFCYKKPNKILMSDKSVVAAQVSKGQVFLTSIFNSGKVSVKFTEEAMEVNNAWIKEFFKKNCEAIIKTGVFELLYLLDHPDEANFIGKKSIAGKNYLAIELQLTESVKDVYFFDEETFYLMKKSRTLIIAGEEHITEIYYSDPRVLQGVVFAYRIQIYLDKNFISTNWKKQISFDPLEDRLFE